MDKELKIAKYDLEGNFLEVLEADNYHQLSIELGVDGNTLKRAVNGFLLTCGNFQFKPINPNLKLPLRIGSVWDLVGAYKRNIIGKYYKGKLICTYDSVVSAAEKNRVEESGISRNLKGEFSNVNGFTFKYLT